MKKKQLKRAQSEKKPTALTPEAFTAIRETEEFLGALLRLADIGTQCSIRNGDGLYMLISEKREQLVRLYPTHTDEPF